MGAEALNHLSFPRLAHLGLPGKHWILVISEICARSKSVESTFRASYKLGINGLGQPIRVGVLLLSQIKISTFEPGAEGMGGFDLARDALEAEAITYAANRAT